MASALPACVNSNVNVQGPSYGFIAGDEPQAVDIGRAMLQAGGSAGDAAAAAALAMTATLPARAGLGGGGVCIVFDAARRQPQTLEFLPRPAESGAGGAVPGLLRGVYALHATLGRLRWEQVVVSAERLARANPAISRATALDVAAADRLSDAAARTVYRPGGRAPAAGSPLSQPALADLLSAVRRNGFAALHSGAVGESLATALGVGPEAVRGYQPRWSDTLSTPAPLSSYTVHVADAAGAGKPFIEAWRAAVNAPAGDRAARVRRALAPLVPADAAATPPGAALVVVDPADNAVACSFTMGAPFGTGRAVPGAGLVTAVPVGSASFGVPVLAANTIVGRTLLAGAAAAAGGESPEAAPAALIGAMLPALTADAPADAALAARPAGEPALVELVTCQVDRSSERKICQTATDPRGQGFAATVEVPGG